MSWRLPGLAAPPDSLIALLLAAPLLFAGCSPAPDAGPTAATVRDSAGVTIREFPGPLPTNEVVLEPVWTHGHDAGDYEFQRVVQGVLQQGTGAVIGDVGNAEVVAIGPDGSSFEFLAGSGQGPDEVRSPGAIVRFGMDSVWVQDMGGKLLLFRRGTLAATVSTAGDAQLSFQLMSIGVAGDGRLLLTTAAYYPDFEEAWLDGTLVLFDPSDGTVDSVATYPMASNHREPMNPFAPFGRAVSAARSFVIARTDRPELKWRRPEGHLFRIDRWRPVPVYPTDADLDAYFALMRVTRARMNPRMSDDELQTFIDDQVGRYALDRSKPKLLFYGMVGGDEGGLWISEESEGGSWGRSYVVMTPDGRVGRADFGKVVSVVDVSDDHVLTIVRDEFDVEAVTVWRYRFVE